MALTRTVPPFSAGPLGRRPLRFSSLAPLRRWREHRAPETTDLGVVVVGASSGIGRECALVAAARGHRVVVMARREAKLAELAEECHRAGAPSVEPVVVDVGDDADVADALERTAARLGRIDAVLHAAGVAAFGRTEDVPAEVFDGVLRTNASGPANVARHLMPRFRDQGHGTFVIVGSLLGHIAVPSMTPYVMSKHAVRALAEQLQVENAGEPGVHICYIAPGAVDTPIYGTGANYGGHAMRPPMPVASARSVALLAVHQLDHPRRSHQIGIANNIIRLGYRLMPRLYGRVVGPAFTAAARRPGVEVGADAGNVLTPTPEDVPEPPLRSGVLARLSRRFSELLQRA